MSAFCLYNALYLGKPVDVLVNDAGTIQAFGADISKNASADTLHIDACGKVLFPSFIDAHTHLRDPGFTWKEDIASGLSAAAHGGFGAVMCMANTDPVNDEATVTRRIIERGRMAHPNGPRVHPIGALTIGLQGKALTCIAELAEAGCVALSNDGLPIESTELFRRAMEYASDIGLIIIDHCEDPTLAKGAHMNEGVTSGLLGLKGQPDIAEAIQTSRNIWLAEYLHLPIHIAHVSARRTVEAIAWGKARGVQVTGETCPHYLMLDDTAVANYNTNAKISPPLRTPADRDALRQAIKDGTIDILVTDHSPHAAHEKEVPFDQAPNGFTGLELALPITYDLVRQGILTEADLVRLWCHKPASLFKLPANHFNEGDPADFFLFDPALEWKVCPENLHSKSHNTPWLHTTVKGRVIKHWLNGIQIV